VKTNGGEQTKRAGGKGGRGKEELKISIVKSKKKRRLLRRR
jgi:hypothetical protein